MENNKEYPYTEVIGDWKYEYINIGYRISTNLKTGKQWYVHSEPSIIDYDDIESIPTDITITNNK